MHESINHDPNELKLFSTLFTGLRGAYQEVRWLDEYEEHATGQKRKSKNFWVKKPVTEQQYQEHLEGKRVLGVGPLDEDNLCRFGVIDIDQYNWSETRKNNLCNQIEKFNFPLVPAMSKSQGVRLYLFCEPVTGEVIRRYLKAAAALLGFTDANTTEIFPKTTNLIAHRGDVGAGITLPYFDAKNTICPAFWNEKVFSLTEFISFALSKVCKEEQLHHIPTINLSNASEFNDGPPCLQTLAVSGFAQGTRSNALINIAVYLRLKHGDSGAETHLPEYNERYMDPPLEPAELEKIVRSSRRKKYFYMCKKEPVCNFCNKALCLERKYGVGNGMSDEVNVVVSHITKYTTEPPLWIVTLNDQRIECETEDLLQVTRFAKLCVERLHLIPNLSAKRLFVMLQKAFDKLEVLDAPSDTTLKGQLLDMFEKFLESRPPAKTRDEIVYGYPFYEQGHVYFKSKDLSDFLELEKVRMEPRKVYKILSDYAKLIESTEPFNCVMTVGGKSHRVWRIKHDQPKFIYEEKQEDF